MYRNPFPGLFIVAGALSYGAAIYERFPGDLSLTLRLQEVSFPGFRTLMEVVSFLGNAWVALPIAGLILLALLLLQRQVAWYKLAGVLPLVGLIPLLKFLIDRTRPSPELVQVFSDFGGMAFPSGHAFQAVVVFGFFIYISGVLIRRRWLRLSCQALLATLILLIGVSRVYLGAHWPSDVLGGYFLGVLFLALLLTLGKVGRQPSLSYP